MRTTTIPLLLLIAGLLPALGCGDDDPTVGEQCRELMTVYCNRASNDCQYFAAAEIQDCITSGVAACCLDQCSAKAGSTEQSIDTCTTAIQGASCTTLDPDAPALPSVCMNVVQTALTSELRSELRSAPNGTGAVESVGALLSR